MPRVSVNLHLDMAGALHQLFDQHPIVTESRLRFAPRRGNGLGQVEFALCDADTAPATTGHRLDHDRKADQPSLCGHDLQVAVVVVIAGHHGHLSILHDAPCLILGPHSADGLSRWTDEGNISGRASLRKGRVLRQKAVARMNRLGAGMPCHLDDGMDPQIAVCCRSGTDGIGLVGEPHVQRVHVHLGIDRDRADSQPPSGVDNTAGDLAAISNQNSIEHVSLPLTYPTPLVFMLEMVASIAHDLVEAEQATTVRR